MAFMALFGKPKSITENHSQSTSSCGNIQTLPRRMNHELVFSLMNLFLIYIYTVTTCIERVLQWLRLFESYDSLRMSEQGLSQCSFVEIFPSRHLAELNE
jgi:hypothetical protein